MINNSLRKAVISLTPINVNLIEKRSFFYWIDVIFNRVNRTRLKKFGPDRVCSEWLLRNGASVKWKGYSKYVDNYNNLPAENLQFFIQGVDATESDIHDIGFYHFDGCKHIEEIKLVQCKKVSDAGLPLLSFLKESLMHLEIRDCKSITQESLLKLADLKNLKTLKMGQLPYVENKTNVVAHLKQNLPNCNIEFE